MEWFMDTSVHQSSDCFISSSWMEPWHVLCHAAWLDENKDDSIPVYDFMWIIWRVFGIADSWLSINCFKVLFSILGIDVVDWSGQNDLIEYQ